MRVVTGVPSMAGTSTIPVRAWRREAVKSACSLPRSAPRWLIASAHGTRGADPAARASSADEHSRRLRRGPTRVSRARRGDEAERSAAKMLTPGGAGEGVLDFRCPDRSRGLRHLLPEAQHAEFWGSDIDRGCIAWNEQHLTPPMSFVVNDEAPPLPLPAADFDLVYAMSVFTHITKHWSAWLLELHRVLAPGGILVATFMGEGMSEAVAGTPWCEEHVGMNVYLAGQSWELGGPMVLHSPWWIAEHWGRLFDVEQLKPVISFARSRTAMFKTTASWYCARRGRPRVLTSWSGSTPATRVKRAPWRMRSLACETRLRICARIGTLARCRRRHRIPRLVGGDAVSDATDSVTLVSARTRQAIVPWFPILAVAGLVVALVVVHLLWVEISSDAACRSTSTRRAIWASRLTTSMAGHRTGWPGSTTPSWRNGSSARWCRSPLHRCWASSATTRSRGWPRSSSTFRSSRSRHMVSAVAWPAAGPAR